MIEHLGDPNGVLIIDDTGLLKKGVRSAVVARQYSGTAGRIANCRIGVFLAYRSTRGHAPIDRQLYLPAAWTDDWGRCRAYGIPDEVGYATKIDMARQMLKQAFAAGVQAAWVSMNEAYGQLKSLRFGSRNTTKPLWWRAAATTTWFTADMGRARVDERKCPPIIKIGGHSSVTSMLSPHAPGDGHLYESAPPAAMCRFLSFFDALPNRGL